MSTQEDFASIVLPAEYLPKWFHLDNKHNSLVQLHSKFWGKSLTCEEELSDNPLHTKSADKDEDLDADAIDDDFIPGCSVLDIGIENLPFQKIWIRADYIRVYNFLEDWGGPQVTNNIAPGAVITGQPGIGKSVWVYYALCRRLVERKPVIWYRDHSYFLFLKEGVFQAPAEFAPSHFQTVIWTLVDYDESQGCAPSRLLTPGRRLFVIYITSPCAHRWSQMMKTVRDVRIIMNPWRKGEIYNAASVYPGCDRERINYLFDQLGPTPQLSLVFNSYRLRTYEDNLRNTIQALTYQALENLFGNASALEMSKDSHKICLISRNTLEDVASLPVVKPITPRVRSMLVSQLRTQNVEHEYLYRRIARTSDLKGLVGVAFAFACRRQFTRGARLVLVPISMVHHLPEPDTSRPPWYSCHFLQRGKESCQTALLKIPWTGSLEYSDSQRLSIQPDAIYVPAMSNQVIFDVFILLNGILNILHFSIGHHHHHLNSNLRDFLAACSGIPPMKDWRSVLITSSDHTVICPRGDPAIPLYSAVMTLDPLMDDGSSLTRRILKCMI